MPEANVAQLVEQLTRNEQVVGSNPTVGSSKNNDLNELYIIHNPLLFSSENFV